MLENVKKNNQSKLQIFIFFLYLFQEGREKLKAHIQDLLGRSANQILFRGLKNPLDPRVKFGKIR